VIASNVSDAQGNRAIPDADLLTTPAVIPLQRHAWQLATSRTRSPVAEFDSWPQVAAAFQWAEEQIHQRADARVLSSRRHRCQRYEYVVRFETTAGVKHFKAGVNRVADEGLLTGLLSALAPGSLPETLAIDAAQGRWIYHELGGELLIDPSLTIETAGEAVSALALLQKRAAIDPGVRRHLGSRRLTMTGLFALVDQIVERGVGLDIQSSNPDVDESEALIDAWRRRRDALRRRCVDVDLLELPHSLVLSDFWPRNVLRTPCGIGFIDVERSYWSLPFLPLWQFAHAVERMLRVGEPLQRRIESAFVDAWADVVPPSAMRRALTDLPLLGRLFGLLLTSRELDLQERELGAALSASYRADVLSKPLDRLLEHASISESYSRTPSRMTQRTELA
jgi:hypothetical protein